MYKNLDVSSVSSVLESYLKQIAAIPVLTVEEEKQLAWQIHNYRRQYLALSAGILAHSSCDQFCMLSGRQAKLFEGKTDPDAALRCIEQGWNQAVATLVKHNLRLVVRQAYRYRGQRDSLLLDLIQEGNIGLLHAAHRFEVERKVRFSTYATYWIHLFIDRASLRLRHLLHYPLRQAGQLRRARSQGSANDIPVSLEELQRNGASDWIDKFLYSEQDIDEHLDSEQLTSIVEQALAALSAREIDVVQRRFGLNQNEEQTLQVIAKCRIPDDYIIPSRHGYLLARSVLQEILGTDRGRGKKMLSGRK